MPFDSYTWMWDVVEYPVLILSQQQLRSSDFPFISEINSV